MSSSSWNSELVQEGLLEESVSNEFLQSSLVPDVLTYGAELELPRINHVGQKYIQYVLDYIKLALYQYVKVAIPEVVSSQNKVYYTTATIGSHLTSSHLVSTMTSIRFN